MAVARSDGGAMSEPRGLLADLVLDAGVKTGRYINAEYKLTAHSYQGKTELGTSFELYIEGIGERSEFHTLEEIKQYLKILITHWPDFRTHYQEAVEGAMDKTFKAFEQEMEELASTKKKIRTTKG